MRSLYLAVILSCISPAAHSQTACLREFTEFIAQFESSAEFQRRNTRFPLSTVRTDRAAQPEPKAVFHTINSPADPQYADVLFPAPAKQAATPLKQRIKKGSGARFVLFTKPGTSGTLTFTFEMSAGCWQLIKFEDVFR
jgi:hypothetical protein